MPQAPTDFGFLFVCTGNICRSPFAEVLMAHALSERLGERARSFHVASAGVRAVVGSGIHPDTRRELAPWGLEGEHAGRFLARQLEPAMAEHADVILTATVEHRTAVLRAHPPALPKTFTLREFARLATALDPAALPRDPVQRAHEIVRSAPAQRGRHRPARPEDDSIADPMGRRRRAHQTAAKEIAAGVDAIVRAITA